MKIQVLLSTMFQTDHSILDKINLQSDAVVINQGDRDGSCHISYKGYDVTWIDSPERGLSRSRNLAIRNADADVCLLCDDDEILYDGYAENILQAYQTLPDAELIVFNVDFSGAGRTEKKFLSPQKKPKYRSYGSVHVSFALSAVRDRILFNTQFGSGSGVYLSGEDSLFCRDCQKAGLHCYTYPYTVAKVFCGDSTWFTGYNAKYFFDKGAYLAAAFPRVKHFYKWYFPLRLSGPSELGVAEMMRCIDRGIRDYQSRSAEAHR